jgi:hypothetical protein
VKIVAVSALQQFSSLLQKISKLVDIGALHPVTFVLAKEQIPISLSIHRSWLLSKIKELSRYITDIRAYGDEEVVILEIPSLLIPENELQYFMGVETLGLYNAYKYEGDTLVLSEYNASLLLNGIANVFRYGCKYSRTVVFDDEAFKEHYLFQVDNEWWVLKTGDGGSWLNIYSNFNDAIQDYMTVDYGWENWSSLQAQPLKVTPKRTIKFPVFGSLVLDFIEKYGVERILKAKYEDLRKYRFSRFTEKFIEKRRFIGEWICDIFDAIAPEDAEDFQEALRKCLPSQAIIKLEEERKRIEEEKNKIYEEEKKLNELPVAYCFRSLPTGDIVGRLDNGVIVLFNDPKPEWGWHVVLLEWQERTSRKGKKYIKCFKWVKHPHPRLQELKKRYEELREKEKALEKEVERLVGEH